MLKVLHVINGLGSGGAEKLLYDILPILNEAEGIEVELLLLTDKNSIYKEMIESKRIKVYVCEPNKLYSIINFSYIRNLIKKNNYKIVHAHLFPTSYYVSLVSRTIFSKNTKFIFTEHSTHNRRREKVLLRYLEKFIYSSFNKITSISNQTKYNLINWVQPKKNLEKFVVIENGVNLKNYYAAKGLEAHSISQNINENTKLICMVGRFSPQKDQGTLIKAMTLLHEDVHLLLVGQGQLKHKYVELADSLGLGNRIDFLGFREDIPNILQSVDIVILSSIWEGFGLAALEGMAAKKPVIVSNVGGLKELIGRTDVLFEVGDYIQLAHIIESLLQDENYYKQVSEYLFERSKEFDINKTVKKFEEIYLNLLEN